MEMLTITRRKRGLGRASAAIAVAGLLALLAVTPVLANGTDDQHKGDKAPEAPLALLLPAAGGLVLGGRAILAKRGRAKS
ncbi:MAG: hypothetical protein ACYDAG_18280 [Chloroflexota bacterium]